MTASAVAPLLKHVKSKCAPSEEASKLAEEIRTTIREDLEARYSSSIMSETLSIASFLDPRFKDQYLQDRENTLLLIKQECLKISHIVDDRHTEKNQSTSSATKEHETDSTEAPHAKQLKGLAAVLKHISEEEGQAHALPSLTPDEMKHYSAKPSAQVY